MDRWKEKRWFPWVRDGLVLLLALVALRAYQQRGLVSGQVPELSAVSVSGEPVALAAYRGAPLLLHFWASWCGVCQAEEGNIAAVAADWPVLTVASQSGDAAQVSAYLAQADRSFATIADPEGALTSRFAVRAYPTTFIIDADGAIRHTEVGYTSEWGLRLRLWLARF